ncbi:MAG: hypothetical protein OHK0022_12820 [Roseiflexaceae bacterium]
MSGPQRGANRAGVRLSLIAAILLALCAGLLTRPVPVRAAAFTAGNLVVVRVGNGSAALTNAATPVFLDEFSPSGTLIQSISLPTSTSGGNAALTMSGTASSEGTLVRSTNGSYLTLAGYDAAPGTTGVVSTASNTTNRIVARVDTAGTIDTTTRISDGYNTDNIRGAVTNDGTGFWASGNGATSTGGIRYVSFGSSGASTQLSTSVTNTRVPGIFGDQLYLSASSGTFRGVSTVGSGLPTTSGQTITILPGFPTTTGPSSYGFVLFDQNAGVAGLDTAYVADDRGTGAGGGLQKWTFDGSTWSLAYTLTSGLTAGLRGLTGIGGATPVLYATTADTISKLVTVTDTGAGAAFTTLAFAPTNTAFRGVAFAPVTAQPDLTVAVSGPGTATVGVAYSYTLTVSNQGGASAADVRAQFTLPTGVSFNSASGTNGFNCAESGGTVTCTGATIGASASATITVSVTAGAPDTIIVPVGAAQVDPLNAISESNEGNNGSTTPIITTVGVAPNTPPTISAASPSLRLPSPVFSGVVSDPTDPGATLGLNVTVGDAETPATNLTLTASSSNPAVVPNNPANLILGGSGSARTLRVVPVGVGYASITLTVTDAGNQTASVDLTYAASAASPTPSSSRFHTGAADISTGLAIDANSMFTANDEDQLLRLYDRTNSGAPLAGFDFTAALNLTDISGGNPREVDIESSARNGSRLYWLGSHSNSSGGGNRPNRSRLFATDLAGSNLSFVGYYDGLKTDLIAWDQSNGHGKGANYYGFAASAAAGVIPEDPAGAGFNIEAAEFAPDGTTLYLGFRAPIVPATNRTKALIVPVTNAAALVGGSPAGGPAIFGAPIEFDLGGRGIRELRKNSANEYVLIAGPPDAATGSAPKDFRLYTWTGNPGDAPLLRAAFLTALNTGGSFESIVEVPNPLNSSSQIQLLSDNGDTVWYGDSVAAKDLPNNPHKKFRSDVVALGGQVQRIRDLQGAAHISPLVTTVLSNAVSYGPQVSVEGIVTAVTSNGFYIQDNTPDADPATSEAIFVFTGSAGSKPNVGDAVLVSGAVAEARAGCTSASCTSTSSGWGNLTTTQISANSGAGITLSWSRLSAGNPLPAPQVIGAGGRVQPTAVIDNDSNGSVEDGPSRVFDPAEDGLDFYESLEGMRVQINNAVVVGPTTSNGEIAVLPDNGASSGTRTARGGIIVAEDYSDFNPERLIIDDLLVANPPAAAVGDNLGTVVGLLDYSFGNFKLLNTAALARTSGGLMRETTTLTSAADKLTIGDFNIENFSPQAGQRITDTAQIIVNRMGAPDIVSLQEVQDNNGATNDGVVAADQSYQALINAIVAAGGPVYQYRQIDPQNNSDGGAPGGNIRVGFLFQPSRVTFVDRPGGTATASNSVQNVGGKPQLLFSPGRIAPADTAWSASRKPLAAEFVFNGRTVFVINNHFNSKGGDRSLFGRYQPPPRTTETQRQLQAALVRDFVQEILAIDPQAAVLVTGDLNDFHFSEVLSIVRAGGLTDLIGTLPANERYTYVFDGNAQSLDHILASASLAAVAEYDVVHVNAEFPDAERTSDHDPSVARFTIAVPDTTPPDTTITQQPSNPSAGTFATFAFTGTDNLTPPAGLTFECSLDGGAFSVCTSPTTYSGLSNGSHTFLVQARDAAGNVDPTPASFTWTINTTLPDTTPPDTTITLKPTSRVSSTSATFVFTGTDDVTAPQNLTFECSLDGGAFSTCTNPQNYTSLAQGSHAFLVRARDAAGNIDQTPASFTWIVDTIAPETTLTGQPPSVTNILTATFVFTGTDSGTGVAAFECSLDGGAWADCESPQVYGGLSFGSHTFQVRAKDNTGNVDLTPATYTWVIARPIFLPMVKR